MSKLAVVTGGTRGIGSAISLALKNNGYQVIANYYNNHQIADKFFTDHGINIKPWNIADFAECEKAVGEIEFEYNRPISILVNNAGINL